jgi:hypothetical protein
MVFCCCWGPGGGGDDGAGDTGMEICSARRAKGKLVYRERERVDASPISSDSSCPTVRVKKYVKFTESDVVNRYPPFLL